MNKKNPLSTASVAGRSFAVAFAMCTIALVVLFFSTTALASTPQGHFEKTLSVSGPVNLEVLTRSGDDTMLTFDERGGVREVKIETARAVLTDAVVRRLARAALQIKRAFGGRGRPHEAPHVLPADRETRAVPPARSA